MIQRATSNDLNALIDDTVKKVEALEIESAEKFNQVMKYQEIMHAIQKNINSQIYSAVSPNKNKLMFLEGLEGGTYDVYGNYVHPKIIGDIPRNLLNARSKKNQMIFRDNVLCSINGVEKPELKKALIHAEHPDKDIYYETTKEQELEIVIDITDENYIMLMDVGAIEIDPTIGGNFIVKEIRLLDAYTHKETVIKSELVNAGTVRYFLEEKVSLTKATFIIEIVGKDGNGRYAFGLNHLYFLDGDIDTRSKAILRMDCSDYIDTISEKVYIETSSERIETSLSEIGAKLYLDYNDGVFNYEIETSINEDKHHLAVNTKKFYVEMPLKESVISLQFDQILYK